MYLVTKTVTLFVCVASLCTTAAAGGKILRPGTVETTRNRLAVLWRQPEDIASRDLFYGPGGKQHQPRGTFTFVKEDRGGSNPKFVIEDQDGVKWKVKLGAEARPETVATRLVWAVGYFANEVYFLPLLQPLNMPRRLKRGQKFLDPDGSVRNARLKRELPGEKKNGHWAWREDPFTDTRELNGLRVLMALINNWDLKDENNGIVERTGLGGQRPERIYMVTDLGCSFGTAGPWWPGRMARGNLWSYAHSKFLRRVGPETIDLRTPGKPPWLFFLIKRPEYRHRRDLVWIGRDIPRADARWMGQILARLSSKQIRDAFRAASYSPRQVERFASLVEGRIAELNEL